MLHVDRIAGHSFISGYLDSSSTVVDLGANLGAFALPLLDRYDAQVVGVEPVPALQELFPSRPRLVLEPVAVAHSENGRLQIGGARCATLIAQLAEPDARAVDVPTITLGELFARHALTCVDLLKVDIEGAEFDLLLNTPPDVLRRITQITVEFHDFLEPSLAQGVGAVTHRLHRLGFRRLVFSRDRTDVLFVNQARVRLRRLEQTYVQLRFKYARGAARRLRLRTGVR